MYILICIKRKIFRDKYLKILKLQYIMENELFVKKKTKNFHFLSSKLFGIPARPKLKQKTKEK